MIFSPKTESCLHKSKAWVIVITFCEFLVEFKVESLKFLASPVREAGVTAFTLSDGLLISWPCLDIFGNGTRLTYISVAVTYHQLVATCCNSIEKAVQRAPVIDSLFLAHITIKKICKLKLKLVRLCDTLVIGVPEHDSCHRLDACDLALQRYTVKFRIILLNRSATDDRNQ
jgi:hypothetical protein